MDARELQTALDGFIGSQQLYFRQTPLGRIEYTEGIRFLQQQGGLWLIDAIASYQSSDFKANNPFQSWTLLVSLDTKMAILSATDGNDNVLVSQEIEFTDFPVSQIKIFVEIDPSLLIYLPSEC